MTEQQIRTMVVNTAKSYLGYNEADGSHRKIIDLYNSQNPLPVGYKVTYTDAWCATFVSAIGVKLGLTDVILPECSCPRMVALYQKAGRWMENDAYTPNPGDVVMYDWQDSGVGDNAGSPDHVGLVTSVNGSIITIIEGNKSDSVAYRSLQVNGHYIRGYCLPDYASKASPAAAQQESAPAGTLDVSKLSNAECYEIVSKAQEHARTLPVSGWAAEKFAQAKEHGITDGTSPQAFITREEAAIMADRARGGQTI